VNIGSGMAPRTAASGAWALPQGTSARWRLYAQVYAPEGRESAYTVVDSRTARLCFSHSLKQKMRNNYSFAYSALVCLRTGRSGVGILPKGKESWYVLRAHEVTVIIEKL
jgi:hypothetical protein